MSFTEAIKKSVWVRRRGWGSWIIVKGDFKPTRGLTRDDFLATDWMAHESTEGLEENLRAALPETQTAPDAVSRFSLLELE